MKKGKSLFSSIMKVVFVLILSLVTVSLEKTSSEVFATSQIYDVKPMRIDQSGADVSDQDYYVLRIQWTNSDGLGSAAVDENSERSNIEFRFDPNIKYPEVDESWPKEGFKREEIGLAYDHIENSSSTMYGYNYIKLFFNASMIESNTGKAVAYIKMYSLPSYICVTNGTTTRDFTGTLRITAYSGNNYIDKLLETTTRVPKNATIGLRGVKNHDVCLFNDIFYNHDTSDTVDANIWLDDTKIIVNPNRAVDYEIKFNLKSTFGYYYNTSYMELSAKLVGVTIVNTDKNEISPQGISLTDGTKPYLRVDQTAQNLTNPLTFMLKGTYLISCVGMAPKNVICYSDEIAVERCSMMSSSGKLFSEKDGINTIINTISENETLKLMRSCSVKNMILLNKKMNIDLNGYDIIFDSNIDNLFSISQDVSINNSKSTGEITTNVNSDLFLIKINNGGSLNLSCNITAIKNIISVNNGGTLLLNGRLTTSRSDSYCVTVEPGGNAYLGAKASLINSSLSATVLLNNESSSSQTPYLYGSITNSYFAGTAKVRYANIPDKEIVFVNQVNDSNKDCFVLDTIHSDYYVKYENNQLLYKKGYYEFANLNSINKICDGQSVTLDGSILYKEQNYSSGSYQWYKKVNNTWTIMENKTQSTLSLGKGTIDDEYRCKYTSPTGIIITKDVVVKITQSTPNWEYTIDKLVVYTDGETPVIPIITLKDGQTMGEIKWDPNQNWLILGKRSYSLTYTPNSVGYKTMTDTVEIEVKELALEKVIIDSEPTKMNYVSYEELNLDGLVVNAQYNSGDEVPITEYVLSYPNSLSYLTKEYGGEISISYTVDGITKTTTFNVSVDYKKIDIPNESTSFTYNGESQTFLSSFSDSLDFSITGNVQTNANTDGYDVVLSLNDPNNICWSDNTKTDKTLSFVINKKELTVTANDVTVEYGDATTNNGFTCVGFVKEESINDLTGTLEYEWTCDNNSVPNDYEIKPKGYTSDNYVIDYVSGVYKINPRIVSIIWTEDLFVYDGTDHSDVIEAYTWM